MRAVDITFAEIEVNKRAIEIRECKTMKECWDETVSVIKSMYGDGCSNMVEMSKGDILLQVYSFVKWAILEPIPKNRIVEAYYTDEVEGSREQFATISRDLKTVFSDLYMSSHSYTDFNAIEYLSQFWSRKENGTGRKKYLIRSFNNRDFAGYIHEYKHWPFHPDNVDGMKFSELFKSMRFIIERDGRNTLEDYKRVNFGDEHSAFIFSELFGTDKLFRNVVDFLGKFPESFSAPEKTVRLIIPLVKLPHEVQNIKGPEYYKAVKKHLQKPDEDTLLMMSNQLGDMLFFAEVVFPCAVTVLMKTLIEVCCSDEENTIPKEGLEQICGIIEKEYVSGQFSYRKNVLEQFERFSGCSYPSKTINGQIPKEIKLSDDGKRYNTTIERFERAYTYAYMNSGWSLGYRQLYGIPIKWRNPYQYIRDRVFGIMKDTADSAT